MFAGRRQFSLEQALKKVAANGGEKLVAGEATQGRSVVFFSDGPLLGQGLFAFPDGDAANAARRDLTPRGFRSIGMTGVDREFQALVGWVDTYGGFVLEMGHTQPEGWELFSYKGAIGVGIATLAFPPGSEQIMTDMTRTLREDFGGSIGWGKIKDGSEQPE